MFLQYPPGASPFTVPWFVFTIFWQLPLPQVVLFYTIFQQLSLPLRN
jgi:hypothetical protein